MPRSVLIPRLHPRESLGPEYLGAHGQLWAANTPSDYGQRPKKTSHACEPCRSRRIKCDGRKPSCSACLHSKRRCEYSDFDRRRRGDKDVELDVLREKIRSLDEIMSCLKHGSNEDIARLISSMRESAETSGSDSEKADWQGFPDQVEVVQDQTQLEQSSQTLSTEVFGPENLPPEAVIRLGLNTFYSGSFILFYVFEEDEARTLCDQVYHSGERPTRMALSELCALAAVGHTYDGDKGSVPMMEALYRAASSLSNECLDEKPLRVMRVLVCLSMYAFMTKKYSARLSIATGLQIARWARLDLSPDLEIWVSWRKVYRTLVFLECWLSATIGYQYDLSESEIEFTKSDIIEPQPSFENAIQTQMSAVGLLMASILQEIYSSKPITFSNVGRCSLKLDDWRRNLPPLMELSAITAMETAEHVDNHRRSLFLVHALYMGAKMLLYRPLLVAIAKCGVEGEWSLDGSFEMGKRLQLEGVDVAKTCVRLLNLLNSGSHWLCISHASAACGILLLDVALRLLERNDGGVSEDLTISQECIGILKDRSGVSRIAEEMLNDFGSLQQYLITLMRGRDAATQTTADDEFSNTDNDLPTASRELLRDEPDDNYTTAVTDAIRKAIDLVGNPFRYERKFEFEDIRNG